MTNRTALIALATLATLAGCEVTPLYIGFLQVDGGNGGAGGTSSSTTSTTGGAGGALLCAPGTTQSCYDGPAGTEGQGICKAGTQTCAADGASWGPCMGAVLPKPENCATPEDEDCDGKAPPCKGNVLWAERFGGAGDDAPHGIATDAAGNIFVVGEFTGTVDFGTGPLTSAGATDVFVIKLDANGGHIWSKRFGGAGDDVGSAIAVDAGGNIVVTGLMTGTVDFGGGPLTSAGGKDVFVAKLDAGGGHIWSTRFGGAGDDVSTSGIAFDASGNVIATGSFGGSVDFGGGLLTSAGNADIFVAKLDPGGGHIWSRRFGDASSQISAAVATDAKGNIVICGYFDGAPDFGGGALTSAGFADIFALKLDATGGYAWSRRFGSAADEYCAALAVDGAGSVVLTGYTTGAIDFGGGALPNAGGLDIFVTKLNTDGGYVWSQRFGDVSDQYGSSIAVDADDNVVVTGYIKGTADFGGGLLPSAGAADAFVAKFGATGDHAWSKRFGDMNNQAGQAIAADATGNVIVAGYMSGSVDFGTNNSPLLSAGGLDTFVAKLSP